MGLLMAQWLRLCTPNAGAPGLIPGQGTRSHTSNAGENAEKLDQSSMVSETIKWYSHWGKWLGNYIY